MNTELMSVFMEKMTVYNLKRKTSQLYVFIYESTESQYSGLSMTANGSPQFLVAHLMRQLMRLLW